MTDTDTDSGEGATGGPDGRPRRLGGGPRILVALGVAVVLLVGAGALAHHFTIGRYERNLGHVHGVIDKTNDDESTGHATNWLVVGSDSRAARGTSGTEAGDPVWQPGAQRTDTIMLVHLAADGRHISVTSIPRDTWVPIPGHGKAKVNAAFSYGGPKLLVRTVHRLTGLDIDHYAAIDFRGFKTMTDAVGGVDVTVPHTVYDSAQHRTWKKGRHHLDGEDALAYVRQRHGLPGGDLDRIGRQQSFLLALLDKVRSRGTLTNPVRLDRFLDATSKAVTVDDTVTNGTLRGLALRYRNVDAKQITFRTAPIRSSGRIGGQDVLFLDKKKAAKLFAAIKADRTPG